jgi:tetratricopeptide (TPR) repeat protein
MRLTMMIVVPLLFLGGIELTLRLIGYGYPTSFFLRTHIGGRDFYVPNDKFGYRFFPPAQARTPMLLRMPVDKPANTYRIFLLGESAAYGDPDPAYGVGRYLEVLLSERFPKTQFEVVCVAMTAINSHVILPIARECARHQGDLWIIYMGNNEMVGPFGAATVFGPKAPSLGLIRANLALKTTRLGQLLDALGRRLRAGSSPQSWEGMKMFMENRLRYDDAKRLRVYDHLSRNLDDILRAGCNSGVPIILSTMAVNLKDCSPFGSLHAAALNATQKATWDKFYGEGVALEAAGSHQKALDSYLKAASIDHEFADLQFRIGDCHLALTNYTQAHRDFELASDYDALAFRADTRINKIIREAAARYAGKSVHFVDAAEALAQQSPEGIPGNGLFFEHVHLNFQGNYLLARVFANEVAKLLPRSVTAQGKDDWASATFCDRRLAITVWDRYRIWQEIGSRITQPPFIEKLDNVTVVKMHDAELEKIKSQAKMQTPDQARELYEQALALAPDDSLLHAHFARFLEDGGFLGQAIDESRLAIELQPQVPGLYYYTGTLLVRAGKTSEAAEDFSRALAIQRDFAPALNELGLILANQQKPDAAATYFKRALRANRTYVETYVNLGFLEQGQGKLDEAMTYYQEAARLQPRGPADYFKQAVALAAEGRHTEATEYFGMVAAHKPEFWQACYLLGVELASQGKFEEAQAQFSQVIRYRPDHAPAHFNLGVALERQRKLDQALAEFRTTLKLDPGSGLARQHLESIQARNKRGP